MAHVSPIRAVRATRLWLPVLVLLGALGLFAVAGKTARSAHLLEVYGETTMAEVLEKETRERRNSDGNPEIDHYVTYRFEPVEGAAVQRRAKVSPRFYRAVETGGSFPLRYVRHDPAVHEREIGTTRADADRWRALAWTALAAAVLGGAWLGGRALPLLRAVAGGNTRRAVVTGHVEKPQRRKTSGGRYGRIRWRDETGTEGQSGWVPMLDVAGHPVGSRITLIVDPASGRSWWEEEFADDAVKLLQRG